MISRTWKICLLLAVVIGWTGVFADRSEAGLLPVSSTSVPDGMNNRYTYGVVLTSDSQLHTGDYFTIFDFAGLVPNSSTAPSDWSFSTSLTGGNPSQTVPFDDPTLPNLTWTYTGAATLEGQVGLGSFSVLSTTAPSDRLGNFASQTHSSSTGSAEKNVTDTLTPALDGPPPPSVPEPATLALFGLGLPLVALRRYLRKQK